MTVPVVCIGGSTGSVDILKSILSELEPTRPFATIMVVHRGEQSSSMLTEKLRANDKRPVVEPCDKDKIECGGLYLAPPGYHLLISRHAFSLSTEGADKYSRPSINVLFESAAKAFGPKATAIVLSGQNDDGAKGAAKIHACGGTVIIQDPETAIAPSMPEQAKLRVAVATIVSPANIPLALRQIS